MRPDSTESALRDVERPRHLLLALTTEHFTLQTARASTIADSNGRAAPYLSTVSGAVVALAFIGQVAHVGDRVAGRAHDAETGAASPRSPAAASSSPPRMTETALVPV